MALSRPMIVLVTGSTSGIGLAIAKTFAESGYAVIVTGFGDDPLIQSIITELHSLSGTDAHYVPADLRKSEDIENLFKKVKEIHPDGIDVLVNNAGYKQRFPVEDHPVDAWNMMVACMMTAPFHLIKLFLPDMKKRGWGRIVNISSHLGKNGAPNCAAYTAAKHGVLGLTKTVALETAKSGLTCNAICTGIVDTPLFQQVMEEDAVNKGISCEEAKTEILACQPTSRLIPPEKVAETVKFLCSQTASEMTGSILSLDGGFTAR